MMMRGLKNLKWTNSLKILRDYKLRIVSAPWFVLHMVLLGCTDCMSDSDNIRGSPAEACTSAGH